jgi:hypothetical protein
LKPSILQNFSIRIRGKKYAIGRLPVVIVNTLLNPVGYMVFDVSTRIGHHPAENVDDLYWV